MASGAEHFLKKALGEDFMESLQKFELWKPGTKTTIDHEELRTALQIVPRTIIAMLIRELAPMEIGQTKDVELFVGGNASMTVTKHERDVYSGDVKQDNKILVDFKFRSLPGVGLIIMSAFELYDMDNLINSNHTQNPQTPTVSEDITQKVQRLIDERLELHQMVGKVVDHKMMAREAVHSLVLARLTEELKKEKEESERERIRLAGCGVAALGGIKHTENIKPGDYAHSASLDDVRKLYEEKEKLRKENLALKSPVHAFLQSRKIKKGEYSVHMAKGEKVDCPDCGKNIFNGQLFSGCVCLGDDMERKVFIKKSEDGIKVRFSKGWDQENIEMLLEVLRNQRG